jgi:hypothetical protein
MICGHVVISTTILHVKGVNKMRIVKVTGTKFQAFYLRCGGLFSSDHLWADLDGKPLEAYYCHGCVYWDCGELVAKPPTAPHAGVDEVKLRQIKSCEFLINVV